MATAVDIGRVIDEGRWGGYQKWLICLTAMTVVFDGIDNQLLGIVIPTIMRDWHVPRGAFASVVSLGYAGMMIGGAVAGLAGDRWGRRTALVVCLFVFGAMTVVASFAHDTMALGVLRFAAGLGLGGAMPNAAALAAEFVPMRQRPVAVTVTIVCVPLGAMLAGFVGIGLLPTYGWRALFIAGGVIPIVAGVVLPWLLPESPRYLARHAARWGELGRDLARMGHHVPADAAFVDERERAVSRVSVRVLFTSAFRTDTIGLWIAFFSCLFGVYLVFSWLTSLLTGAGFDPGTANSGITAFNLGGVAGALCGGWAITRFGSRVSMLTMAAPAVAGALALSVTTISPNAGFASLIGLFAFTGAMINGVQTTMFALAAHVYPSAVRATGVGTAASFGRSGAVLSGYAGDWTVGLGHATFFRVIAIALASTFAGLMTVRKHVEGHVGGRR